MFDYCEFLNTLDSIRPCRNSLLNSGECAKNMFTLTFKLKDSFDMAESFTFHFNNIMNSHAVKHAIIQKRLLACQFSRHRCLRRLVERYVRPFFDTLYITNDAGYDYDYSFNENKLIELYWQKQIPKIGSIEALEPSLSTYNTNINLFCQIR